MYSVYEKLVNLHKIFSTLVISFRKTPQVAGRSRDEVGFESVFELPRLLYSFFSLKSFEKYVLLSLGVQIGCLNRSALICFQVLFQNPMSAPNADVI